MTCRNTYKYMYLHMYTQTYKHTHILYALSSQWWSLKFKHANLSP